MKQHIQEFFAGIIKKMEIDDAVIQISVPENPAHGDYTTNVAMLLAGRLKSSPMKIAQEIVDNITKDHKASPNQWLDKVESVPPGFINIFVTETCLGSEVSEVLRKKDRYGMSEKVIGNQLLVIGSNKKNDVITQKNNQVEETIENKEEIVDEKGIKANKIKGIAGKEDKKDDSASFGNTKTIMVEFAHPNTHKAFHIGHLRNITTGESIVRLLESQGNNVIRANYQGDIGMHIAKALYALLNVVPFKDELSAVKGIKTRVEFLGKAYAAGSKAFEESEDVKKIVGEINKQIYAKDPAIYQIYKETRQWSLDYFEGIYKRVGSHFDRYYFEGETYEIGKNYVLEGVKKGIFEKSDGAIIFRGENYGLHNRVFISGEGNATYEGKDMGLGRLQFDEYHPDVIIHCVGPEQASYFQVIFCALEQLFPDTKGKERHLVYGWVKLKEGKMSSRSGNVILGEWLMDEVKKEIKNIMDKSISKYDETDQDAVAETVAIGAIKYSFLKVSTPSEIAFDFKESMNTSGDSGPYLQYTYARCKSVLRKAGFDVIARSELPNDAAIPSKERLLRRQNGLAKTMNPDERAVARSIMQFPDIVKAAADNFAPNTLCTYLFGLAQQFNLLYAKEPIIGNDLRLAMTQATAQILKNGLYLLGIEVLEKM